MHNPYADNLHGEKCSGSRSSEKSRKSGTHTAHSNKSVILFIQLEPDTKLRADTAAYLESSTFTSGRTACKMCQNRTGKNTQRIFPGHAASVPDRYQNHICALVMSKLQQLVNTYDKQSCNGKQENNIGLFLSYISAFFQSYMKCRRNKAYRRTCNKR